MSPSRPFDKKPQSRRPVPRRILLAAALASVLTLPRTASAQWTVVSQVRGGNLHIGNGDFTGVSVFGSTAMVGGANLVDVIMQGADGAWSQISTINLAAFLPPQLRVPLGRMHVFLGTS